MKFLTIDPAAKTVHAVDAADVRFADVQLYDRGVDFGVVRSGLGIVVYEYGLLDLDGPYFALNGRLYADRAILYAYDLHGATIAIPDAPIDQYPDLTVIGLSDPLTIHWLPTNADVELAIKAGLVERPEVAHSRLDDHGKIISREIAWTWPQRGWRPGK